jgi:hypothetical protein
MNDEAIEEHVVRPNHAAAVELVSRMGYGCQARLCEQLGVTSMGAAWLVIAMQWSGVLARELNADGDWKLIEARGFY